MGQYDQTEKLLEDYNDVFCDIVNVNLYNGIPIVTEDDLHPSNIQSHYKADDSTLHEQERDTAKYWKKGGVTFALYSIENQTNPDKKMPLRIISYDGANYRSQLLETKAQRFYQYHPTPLTIKHVDEVLKMLEVLGGAHQLTELHRTISALTKNVAIS